MAPERKSGDGGGRAPGSGRSVDSRKAQALGQAWRMARGWPVFATVLFIALLALLLVLGGASFFEPGARERGGLPLEPPGDGAMWGTDATGGSVFLSVTRGVCKSIMVAILAWFMALTAGTGAGLCGALFRNRVVPRFMMEVHGAWVCFPLLFLGAAFVVRSGGGLDATIVLLGIFGSIKVGREVVDVLSLLHSRSFLKAAVAAGLPPRMLWADYHLTHAASAGFAASWSVLPFAFLWEASLGFITASAGLRGSGLGPMMAEGRIFLLDAPWLIVAPSAALALLVFAGLILEMVGRARLARHRDLVSPTEERGGLSA